ncbi:CFDP1 [Branchiostoma lanceolatum]|uniref:Craniofacial development protein 1 n=1 Tax=Branchiostoma lanceolatum TaxID=7740 RepID=A0A8K0EUJ7_BRALA|nr:CFDP1 [Branchiostoma lanceolatum]
MSDSEDQFSSDSEDEDYVPSGGEISEDSEPEGEEEDGDFRPSGKKTGRKGQKKNKSSLPVRQSKRGVQFANEEEEEDEEDKPDNEEEEQEETKEETEKPKVKEEVEKKKADDLWASFLKDVGGPPARPKTSSAGALGSLSQKTSSAASTSTTQTKPKSKVTVTKVYDFAGEEVKVAEEVDADSIEAQCAPPPSDEKTTDNSSASNVPVPQQSSSTAVPRPGVSTVTGVKRPAGGGLGSVLSKIGKKPKMSTLVKSKIDWDSYKKDEKIEEDLAIHNRGKEGYLERQAFLQRTDLRQFEVERNMRMANRNVPR